MKYVFFDCEFASTRGGNDKICKFGYVIVNEKFEVIEKDNFIINPNITKNEWDYYALKKILTRRIYEYENNPSFFFYYEKIKDILENSDYIFGHTISSDAKAINDECIRYSRESINFIFYDVKEIYKQYSNCKRDLSVSNIKKALYIAGEELEHDALADAYNTMLILKALLEKLDVSAQDLIELVPTAKDECNNYKVSSIVASNEKRRLELINPNFILNNINFKNNKVFFRQFIDNVKPKTNGDKLKNKKISITMEYENKHFKQILNIIQMITNEGGECISKASLSDIFIKYDLYDEDGNLINDLRYNYVIEANKNGSSIEIINFNDFLKLFDITEEELDAIPSPSFEFLLSKDAVIRSNKIKRLLDNQDIKAFDPYIDDDSMSSIGEYCKVLLNEKNNLQ